MRYRVQELNDIETGEPFEMLHNTEGMAEAEIVDALIRLRAHDPEGYEHVADLIEHMNERHSLADGMEA